MSSPPPPELSDRELARAAQENVDAFEKIIERYEKPLLRYILRISCFSPEEAAEILQEVFLKAWQNLQEFDASLKFSSWIYRITHNETISEFRRHKSRGRDHKVEWNEELFTNLPDKIDLPAELDKELDASKMKEVLKLLPEKYRTVLVLRFLEEKSYDEIADILHIPLGTAATLVNRAKKAFAAETDRARISFSTNP